LNAEVLSTQEEIPASPSNPPFSIAELLDTIAQLPAHHRWVFNLYVMEKYTHAQIAQELDISEGTSKSHLARARKQLRIWLLQKAEAKQKKSQDQRFLLPWLSPNETPPLDQLFQAGLNAFSLAPKQPLALGHRFGTPPQNPKASFPKASGSAWLSVLALASIAALVWLVQPEEKRQKTPTLPQNTTQEAPISENFLPPTATISKDSIIPYSNPKQLKNMKRLDSLAWLMAIAASTLNPGTAQEATHQPQESAPLSTDTALENPLVEVSPENPTDIQNGSGTFRASKLFWSPEDQELYFKGKVRVDFEDQHFQGQGTFEFLGKVYLLILNEELTKPGDRIDLLDADYNLVTLGSQAARAKYGNKGRRGAVEISLRKR
ncbi:MAG: sigma-70 region 4 domain-containing protein, partial [Bacteroidota bacterium]